MAEISFKSGNLLDFQGDALICFCNSDLSQKGDNLILRETGNGNLSQELSSIGYCEIGSSIITQSYNSNLKNYIFIPCIDRENEVRLNTTLLHKALRSAFTLANLYSVNKLAISLEGLRYPREESKDITKSIAGEFKLLQLSVYQ